MAVIEHGSGAMWLLILIEVLCLALLAAGIVTLARARSSGECAGYVLTGLLLIGLAGLGQFVVVPAAEQVRTGRTQTTCVAHLHNIAVGLLMYMHDFDDHLPAEGWSDALLDLGYLEDPGVFHCPDVKGGGPDTYALNETLAGRLCPEGPGIVMAFESDLGLNALGGPQDIIREPRHGGTISVLYTNGAVEAVPADEVSQLRWE